MILHIYWLIVYFYYRESVKSLMSFVLHDIAQQFYSASHSHWKFNTASYNLIHKNVFRPRDLTFHFSNLKIQPTKSVIKNNLL